MANLPEIIVPPRYRDALRALAELPQAQYEQLVSGLRSSPVVGSSTALAAHVGEFDDGESLTLRAIVDALVTLSPVVLDADTDIGPVATELGKTRELRLNDHEAATLSSRLAELLSIDVVRLAGHATDLRTEHAADFARARIITDIRPLFDRRDPDEKPSFAIVSQTLRLDFYDDGYKSLALALSESELRALGETVDRAKRKLATVKALAEESGLRIIEDADGGTEE